MPNTIGKRLRSYRKKKGINVVDFSGLIGITQGSLSALENDKSKPSSDTLANLVRYTDINIRWLLTGLEEQGEVDQETTEPDPEITELLEITKRALKSGNQATFDILKCNIRYFDYVVANLKDKKELELRRKKPRDTSDKDFNIRQQIADIKDALMVMGIKTGIFKDKKEAEVNANTPLEQQVSGIRDTLNAMCIKMGLLEDRRKEQVPIGFPCRRHSNDE